MEFIRGTQTRFGQNGNIGGIPPEYVARRYEMTCLAEPETMLYDYHREVLKDNTCVPPSLESDMPRYYHAADNLLNVLHEGQRSKIWPEHSEIYIANTVRDKRGTQTMPDMRQHKEALETRIRRYTDLRSDSTSDQSISSGVWQPHAINQAIRSTWPGLKSRWNWFDRSLTAMWPGQPRTHSQQRSILDYIESDEDKNHTLAEITPQLFTPSEVVLGRHKKTVIVGARHVPTHVFGVARFGSAPPSSVYKYDASKNMDKAIPTKSFQKSEEAALRGLAIAMAAETGCVRDIHPTTSFDMSHTGVQRHRGQPGDVRAALDDSVQTQQVVEAFVAQMEAKHQRAPKGTDLDQQRLHRLIDEEMYSDAVDCPRPGIRMIEDPYSMARWKRNQITEIDCEGSIVMPIYATPPPQTLDQIRAARGLPLMEYDADESATVYRGKNNLQASQQHDIVSGSKEIDDTHFTDFDIAEHLVGPIGDKSRIRQHLRFEPRGGLDVINSQFVDPHGKSQAMVMRNVSIDRNEPDLAAINRDMASTRL